MKKSLVLGSLMVSGAAFAQAPAEVPPPNPWSGTAEATVLATTGNSDSQSYGLSSGFGYKPSAWFHTLKLGYASTYQAGIQTAENVTIDLRSGRDLSAVLDVFVGFGYLRNVFAGFQSRNTVEAGAGYKILPEGAHTLRSELAAAYVNENYVTGGALNFAGLRAGLQYRWQMSPTTDLSNELNALFSLNTGSDWRLHNTLAFTAAIDTRISVKTGFRVDYKHVPVAGKKATDTTTVLALVAKF